MIKVLAVEITNRCLLRCPGCYAYKDNKEMNYKTYKKAIKRLPLEKLERLELTGGEPFLHNSLEKIIDYSPIKPIVFTSGYIWSKKTIKKIKNKVKELRVTIKYPDKDLDNAFKGRANAHQNALELLKLCNKFNMKTKIHFVVDKTNIYSYDKMLELAEKYNSELEVLRFINTGNYKHIVLPKKEFFKLRVYPNGYCTAGLTRICITVNGDVLPCIYIRRSFGNILNEKFETIKERMVEWRLRKPLKKNDCLAWKN